MNNKDGGTRQGDSDDSDGHVRGTEVAAAADAIFPTEDVWLEHLVKATARYTMGDGVGMLNTMAPLHRQMEAGIDGQLRVFAPALRSAWVYSQRYTKELSTLRGAANKNNLYFAVVLYEAVKQGLDEHKAVEKEQGAKRADIQPHTAAKLPLSYTYCFHAAADTWVPAARAARTTAAKPAKTTKAAAPQQQMANSSCSSSTRCHASADGLWLSTPLTYNFDAAADTWVLPAAAAKPPTKKSSSGGGDGSGRADGSGKGASHVATAAGWQPAPTTYTFDTATNTWAAPATGSAAMKAAPAAAAAAAVSGGRSTLLYSRFAGGWVSTRPAADAEGPAGARQRRVRCTYHYDAASDGWVRSGAPAEHVHAAAAAKSALEPVAKHGSDSAPSHTCTADGWRPAPPTYAFDAGSDTWTLGSAAAIAAASTASAAPAAPTAALAATPCAPAHEVAAAAAALADAMSPPAFLAFARRGSSTSKAAAPAAAAAAAAAVANALSPPAALAFARRGSATPRAAAKTTPPPQAPRTYAYVAARDAWFCPTLDYGRAMPTVCKEPPAAEQQAAPDLDTLTGCCPYRRVAALLAAVQEPLERIGIGKLVRQQVHVHEAAFAEEFEPLCGCAVCDPRVAAEWEVQRAVVRLARDRLPTLEYASKDQAADVARAMHMLAKDASSGDCFACSAADALLREVWLKDVHALLIAATDAGCRERTVRYLQTAIDDMAAALRRAWRLQPEALMELKGRPEAELTLLLPYGSAPKDSAKRTPLQGAAPTSEAAATPAAAVEPSQPLKLAGVKFGLPAPAAGSSASDGAAAAAAAAGKAAAQLAEGMRKLQSPLLAAARRRMIRRVCEYLVAMPVTVEDATAGSAGAAGAADASAFPPPLKTAGVKWRAAAGHAASQDTTGKAAKEEWFVPIVAPLQPFKTAGIKWQTAEPEPTPLEDKAKDTQETAPTSPPWTAAPAVSGSPVPYGVACGTPAAVFEPAAAAPCPFCPPAPGNDDEQQPMTFCSKLPAASAAANADVSTAPPAAEVSDDATADGKVPTPMAAAAIATTGLPALDLAAVLDGFITVPLCKEDGSQAGDVAVIIAEDEAGGAHAGHPAGSFLADVEAKLAAAAGENVGCSDDEWVHCDPAAAADGHEQAGGVGDGAVDSAEEYE